MKWVAFLSLKHVLITQSDSCNLSVKLHNFTFLIRLKTNNDREIGA